MGAFERANLLKDWPGKQGKGDAFFLDAARKAAEKIRLEDRTAVLLGRNAARAFDLAHLPWMTWAESRGGRVAVLPHPSGINLWYNSSKNSRKARKFMSELVAAR